MRNLAWPALMVICISFHSCSKKPDEKVREPAVSGSFYPEQADVLERKVDEMLTRARETQPRPTPVPGGTAKPAAASEPKTVQGAPAKAAPAVANDKVRPAALAGSWYDGEAEALAGRVGSFLGLAGGGKLGGYPMALIVPHAGYRFSGQTAAHAYLHLKGRTYARVFLLGPSHRAAFRGVSLPRATHYQTPLGKVPLDTGTVAALEKEELFQYHPSAHAQEHSLEIQLPFLQQVLGDFQLVPMLVSRAGPEEVKAVAGVLKRFVRPGDLVIASSDFTHWGGRFSYQGPPGATFGAAEAPRQLEELLRAAWEEIRARDLDGFFEHKRRTGDTICGFLPIAVLLALLPSEAAPHLLATDTSGNLTGQWDSSVSYLSAAFTGLWPYNAVDGAGALTEGEKADLLKFARATVDSYVRTQERPSAEEVGIKVTERMEENSGVFVTLKKRGQLRGCIGTIPPVKPLLQAVSDNAVNAAHFDRRFRKVVESELGELTVEVSVLTPPAPIDDWRKIILGKHGILLGKGRSRAVYLPQVAPEQGWTLEETLTHLAKKAGLGQSGWRDGASFEVFEAIVFHENE